MTIIDFFRRIGVPNTNPGVSEAEIAEAEARLGGKLPDGLRTWFREADGFDGEAGECSWRFKSLRRLASIAELFPATQEIAIIENEDDDSRNAPGDDYVVFCDALIYAPFYAVNIRPGSPRYSEVVMAMEELAKKPLFVAATFEEFAAALFGLPSDEAWLLL